MHDGVGEVGALTTGVRWKRQTQQAWDRGVQGSF